MDLATHAPRTATRLGDHGAWRPEWTSSRPRLLWYLTFEDQPQVARGFRRTMAALRRIGCVHVVPEPWLHLTVAHIGFADEVDDARLDAAAGAVEEVARDTAPLRLTTGSVRTLSDAVVVAVDPVDQVDRLRRLQAEVRSATVGAGVPPDAEDEWFWPHVSLGYAHGRTDATRVAEVVESTPPTPTEVVTDRLTQAVVTRAHGHYRWQARAELSLTGSEDVEAGREHHASLHG